MNVKCKALYLYFGYKILHFLKHGLSKKVYNMKIKKEDMLMKYTKPTVITAEKVNAAKCGDGPCGRPCSTNRA